MPGGRLCLFSHALAPAPLTANVRRKRTRMEASQPPPSLLLDLLIVAIGAGLLIAASKFELEAGHPATRGAGSILGGVYILYVGVLFLLSYFIPRRCFLFSFLGYVCKACSRPAGRPMAWFYFALSVAIGSVLLLLIGLGVI